MCDAPSDSMLNVIHAKYGVSKNERELKAKVKDLTYLHKIKND